MLRSIRKIQTKATANPLMSDVRSGLSALISTANRAETASIKQSDLEVTDARDVAMAKELVAAQREFLKTINLTLSRGSTVQEIKSQVVDPVFESAVVGDVAWLVVNNVLASAEPNGTQRLV